MSDFIGDRQCVTHHSENERLKKQVENYEHLKYDEWFELAGENKTNLNFDEWLIEQALKGG